MVSVLRVWFGGLFFFFFVGGLLITVVVVVIVAMILFWVFVFAVGCGCHGSGGGGERAVVAGWYEFLWGKFYFILIRYLYYFNEMNVKIESLMLGVLWSKLLK